jgi:hypothetical protein
VVFEVSLHDEAAQGMSDEHGLAAEAVGRGMNVVDVVGDRARVETLRGGTAAVPGLLLPPLPRPASSPR